MQRIRSENSVEIFVCLLLNAESYTFFILTLNKHVFVFLPQNCSFCLHVQFSHCSCLFYIIIEDTTSGLVVRQPTGDSVPNYRFILYKRTLNTKDKLKVSFLPTST